MFALLFDRKSLTMTLLSLGGAGLLLFVSGFALGSYLNGGLEHLGVVAEDDAIADSTVASGATAPASPPTTRRAAAAPDVVEVEAPAPPEAAVMEGVTDEASSPPADWVPPFDGAPWPGEEPSQEGAAEEARTAEMAIAETTDPEMPESERTASKGTASEEMPPEMAAPETAVPEIRAASMKVEKASLRRATGFYHVQLGTFSREELALEKRDEAQSFFADLKSEGVAPFLVLVTDRGGRTAYAVRVGPFPTRSAAREAAAGYGRASVVWSPSGRTL